MTDTIAATSIPSAAAFAERPRSTPAPQPSSSPPSPGGVISDMDYRRLSPAEQNRYALVSRSDNSGSEWRARTDLGGTTRPATAEPQPTGGEKIKIGDYELSAEDVAMLMRTRAELDARKLTHPETPGAYEAKLPPDFKLPPGFSPPVFNEGDPLLGQAKALAHELGVDQSGFSKMLALWAGAKMAEDQEFQAASAREMAKLGQAMQARLGAVSTFLRAEVGDEGARALLSGLFTAKQVEAFESMIMRRTSQGAAMPFTAAREPPDANRGPSDAEWAGMSYAERADYARSHTQQPTNGGGRRR